ncbi:amidohydrolase family protein [Roseomonas aeriglobus]|nr:amidohydrolase family protein [Roseomonas aeriglobus]
MIRIVRKASGIAISLLASTAVTAAAGAETVAFVHARVLAGAGPDMPDASVIVRDGIIIDVGPAARVPAAARIIDLKGATLTPGFIAADTALGTVEVNSDDGSNDVRSSAARLSAGVDVQYALDGDATPIPVALLGGVTGAIVFPESSQSTGDEPRLFAGQGAAISLGRYVPILIRPKIGVAADMGEAGTGLAGGSRETSHVLIRAAFDEARRYRTNKSTYSGDFQVTALSRPDLEALIPVLDQRVPLVVSAHRAADIRQAIALAKDYGLKIVIRGGEEAWRVASELAAIGAGVILNPTDNLPKSFEVIGSRSDSARILAAAGVPIAIIGNDSNHRVREMRLNAGMAVARGLPYADAIRALTSGPAKMFGLEKSVGTIERGKRADLVIWNGDPLEPLVQPQAIFVAGVEQPLQSRLRDLADRYSRGGPPD